MLDDLLPALGGVGLCAVSKSAVSQARRKLNATVFERLNAELTASKWGQQGDAFDCRLGD